MAGAAGHALHRETGAARLPSPLPESNGRIAGDGALLLPAGAFEFKPAPLSNIARRGKNPIHSRAPLRVACVADIQAGARLARDHVASSRKRFAPCPPSPPFPALRELPAPRPKSTPPPQPLHRALNAWAWCPHD